jgi:DNA mismatch repair protein MutS2
MLITAPTGGITQKAGLTKNAPTKSKPAPTLEINVIGLTVHEALPEIEAFLDAAVISNLEELRIVHGMGTGKLRAGIHEYLRTHPNVAEFRLGKYGEGDTGVTILKIK